MAADPSIVEPNRCNCAALRKATRRMSLFYDNALAPSGLRGTQFAILGDLFRRGGAPPTIRELSEAMVLDQSTIGQNLRPLEREDLIELVQDENDRRSRRIMLTKAGRSRYLQARPLWSEAQAHFEKGFGVRAAAELRELLAGIANDSSLIGEGEPSHAQG
jgi:DNA-binding MarR family transcriptional regulator